MPGDSNEIWMFGKFWQQRNCRRCPAELFSKNPAGNDENTCACQDLRLSTYVNRITAVITGCMILCPWKNSKHWLAARMANMLTVPAYTEDYKSLLPFWLIKIFFGPLWLKIQVQQALLWVSTFIVMSKHAAVHLMDLVDDIQASRPHICSFSGRQVGLRENYDQRLLTGFWGLHQIHSGVELWSCKFLLQMGTVKMLKEVSHCQMPNVFISYLILSYLYRGRQVLKSQLSEPAAATPCQ